MRILIITQKIDENDDILGFFCSWLNELGKKIDKIYVLALEKGHTDLPKNIKLYSLGKENGNNRLKRFIKLNYVIAKIILNRRVDIIFVHMCPEYALLAFPYAKLARIPIIMWYAHGRTDTKLKIAHPLVDKIITPSRESFRIKSNKAVITGHGIDVNKFKILPQNAREIKNNGKKIILSVGRISPIKNYEILIKAVYILVNQMNIEELKFQIVGGVPLPSQNKYLYFLENVVSQYKLKDYIQFVGPVPYKQIHNYYQNCNLFISTSNTGSLDKAVLEAMACGKIVLTCNEAFCDLLKIYSHLLMFDKNDIVSLVEKIIYILDMENKDKDTLAYDLRKMIVKNHSLDRFIDNITTAFRDAIDNK